MIKVLMLVPSIEIGSGVASFAIEYYRKLNHNNVQMDFACYYKKADNYLDEIKKYGNNVFYLPPLNKIFSHYKECKEIISKNQYDIIHDCSLINTIPMMYAAKKRVKIRILHSHNSKLGESNSKIFRNSLFLPLLRSCCNQYAACSDYAAKALFGKKQYQFIPNVINSDKFDFSENTRKTVRSKMKADNKLIIGSVGRCAIQKNPLRALEIFKELLKFYPNAEYWWIGDGILATDMKKFSVKNGISEHVRFLGNCKNVQELYQSMDVFFMPSLFEGLPIACIEAQVSGLPCILSSNITKNVVFTNLVEFVPLSKDNKYWAEKIANKVSTKRQRCSHKEQLLSSTLSERSAGERLEHYYRNILHNL